MKKYTSLFLALICTWSAGAQQARPLAAADIYQQLQQLKVLGTVMYVAAHPDDENTRLLSYLVHHDDVNTIYLSLTRGDGGQNILGQEQGSALGLIRTYELMEARKIDGAGQLFTSVIDFGYTKSPEETFKFWDKASLVQEVVHAFETYRPDVVICRFPTTGEGGHGQHTASAIVAKEAFQYLAQKQNSDSSVWLPKRLLFNAFNFGNRNTTSPDQFRVPINQYDPLLGEGYGEMAGRSRSIHRSQGAGTPQSVGVTDEYFKLMAGVPMQQSIYDGIDISWNRVGHPEIGQMIDEAIAAFDFNHPSASLHALGQIRSKIADIEDSYWKHKKLKEVNAIMASCAGIMVEVLTDQAELTPNSSVPVKVRVISRSENESVSLMSVSFTTAVEKGGQKPFVMQPDSLYQLNYTLKLSDQQALSEPYWLRYAHPSGAYHFDPLFANMPVTPNNLTAGLDFNIMGKRVHVQAPVSYKYLHPTRGDVVNAVRVVPPITISPHNNLLVYEPGGATTAWVRINALDDAENMDLQVKQGESVLATKAIGSLAKGKDTLLSLVIPTKQLKDDAVILFSVKANGMVYTKEQHLITYDHLPELQYFTHAWMKPVAKTWKSAVTTVGYLQGAGDLVDGILSQAGVAIEQLNENAMSSLDYLKGFDAIVIGVRALNTKAEMKMWMPTLLRYVEQGGNLLVQYNTNKFLQTEQLGPYPIELSRDRVTDEEAVVTFIHPESPLLNFPNKITSADFDNWVQERGIYFPGTWDSRYQTVLSMHDAHEAPLNSGILYTPYGKGHFVYTSLVFFRQLPAGNAGAIKLLLNLLSIGKTMPTETAH